MILTVLAPFFPCGGLFGVREGLGIGVCCPWHANRARVLVLLMRVPLVRGRVVCRL